MGKRGFSRDFIRKQEAASAYKKALVDAAASLKDHGHLIPRSRPLTALVGG